MRILKSLATQVIVAFVAILLGAASSFAGESVEWSVTPVGGCYRMFVRDILDPDGSGRTTQNANALEPIVLRLQFSSADGEAHSIVAHLRAEDFFGKPIGWTADCAADVSNTGVVVREVTFPVAAGYFRIDVDMKCADQTRSKWTDVGVIPSPHAGMRKDSFFASNAPHISTTLDIDFFQSIGMKIARYNFVPEVGPKGWTKQAPNTVPLQLDFSKIDADLARLRSRGLWVLPIAGCALPGDGALAVSELAEKAQMYGPPRNNDEYVHAFEEVFKRYPSLNAIEFWNEPWIFGWEWAATPQEYRTLQKQFAEAAKRINPGMKVLAGNSVMFAQDHIEHDPACWKGLLDGLSHHPYTSDVGEASFRTLDNTRSIDFGFLVQQRMKLPHYYLTEGGTSYLEQIPETAEIKRVAAELSDLNKKLGALTPKERYEPAGVAIRNQMRDHSKQLEDLPSRYNNKSNADKIVQYYVNAALRGCFQCNAQWEIGYAPFWTRSNTSFAVMAYFLEDRPCLADIWPTQELLAGAIFANPSQITDEVRALPRAKEISARWNVAIPEERSGDKTKVAVLWTLTGADGAHLDAGGTILIPQRGDLRAYTLAGHEIEQEPKGKTLLAPIGQAPLYITSEKLSVVELRSAIASAKLSGLTPVNLYAFSLLKPAAEAQTLSVRLENQMNLPVTGTLSMQVSGVDSAKTVPFTAAPAQLIEVQVPWPGAKDSGLGVDVQFSVECDADDAGVKRALQPVSRRQIIQSAHFVKRTIAMTGSRNDWDGVAPVVLDSGLLKSTVDLSTYLLNPNLKQPAAPTETPRVVTSTYTAYDDQKIYIAAEVFQEKYVCKVGDKSMRGKAELPYKRGMPDGLDHIFNFDFDALGLAFGFRDRVPGFGRQMDDPYAWKGHFYDTDYLFVAHASPTGEMCVQLWGPDTSRRDAYQTEAVPGVGPVAGAQLKIVRDEEKKLTFYELALPRSAVPLFDPNQPRCRFGFALHNSAGAGVVESVCNWADTAGVFDYWRCNGSWAPTWCAFTACETFFGIDH